MGKVKVMRKKNITHSINQNGKVKKPVSQDKNIKVKKKTSIIKQKVNLDNHSKSKKKRNKNSKNRFKLVQDNEVSSSTIIQTDQYIQIPESTESTMPQSNSTQKLQEENFSFLWLNYKPHSAPLIKAESEWYRQLINDGSGTQRTDPDTVSKLKDLAAQILQHDVVNYNRVEETGSKMQEVKFRKTVISHGTLRDKLAAHVLRCMEAPVHSLSHLNALIALVTPKAKKGYEEALSYLIELFESTFMPNRRTARKFETHNFFCLTPFIVTNPELAEKQLALWYFEDQLAFAYQKLVRQLTQASHDTVDKNKLKGVRSLIDLLANNPDQEVDLILESVINKLGDPSRKVAAKTMYCLRTLLQRRPSLKSQVITSVEIMLFRPNVSDKAQYYCLCFLKDIIFSSNDQKLATKLLKLYFGFFKACTKKGEVDTRLMAALLRGINRAFPFTELQGSALEEQLETLYKLCHLVNFAIATQALQLIYQLLRTQQQISNRFYQILYNQLQDPAFGTSSANNAFLNLVFKALVSDDSLQRTQAFIKRLLQTCQYQSSHLTCGILYLIAEVIREKPELKNMTQTLLKKSLYDDDDEEDGLEVYADAEDIDDPEVKEVESKEKHGAIFKEKQDTLKEDEEQVTNSSVKDSQSIEENDIKGFHNESPVISSWVHQYNAKQIAGDHSVYDPYHRNPLYCGAEYSPLWELGYLKVHYHPSVSLFAQKVISGEVINYSGDPLHDFTLMRFLDRFVYRNPRKTEQQKDDAGGNVLGRRTQYIPSGVRRVAINTEEFSSLNPEEVPEDEQFFHRYFTQYKRKVKKELVDGEDAETIDDEEFEQYLDNMKRGDADNDSEIDYNVDFAAGATGTQEGEEEFPEDDGNMTDENSSEEHEEKLKFDDEIDDDDSQWQHFSDDSEMDGSGEGDINFDEETAVFSDDDSLDFSKSIKKNKNGKSSPKQKASKKSSDSLSSMFANAESFAHLLEENAEDNMNPITSQSFANKDRAHSKQLTWEAQRNRNFKGIDWRKKKGNYRGAQQQNENTAVGKAKNQLKEKREGRKRLKRGKTH